MSENTDGREALKILIVEDNELVAETIAETLTGSGYEVVGPAPSLEQGLRLACDCELDGALLDVNLAGCFCFPIARVLSGRHVPFMFLTGYHDAEIIPPELRYVRLLTKPFRVAELGAAADAAFGTAALSRTS